MAKNTSDCDWGSKGIKTDAARLLRKEPAGERVERDRSNDKTHADHDGGRMPPRRSDNRRR